MPGVMHSVQILKDGDITPEFKRTTIERLKQKGPNCVPPDIEDEDKYPDFHQKTMPKYAEIANALDIQGNFSLPPPIVDPFALVAKLNAPALPDFNFNIGELPTLNPASLAIMLDLKIAEFTAKIPTIFTPPKMPDFPAPPSIDLSLNAFPNFIEKFEFDGWIGKLPGVFGDIFAQLPSKALSLAQPAINVDWAVKIAVDAKLFGWGDGECFKKIVAEDLIDFTSKCTTIAATALAVGDGGPSGLVGKMTYDDFSLITPPPERKDPPGSGELSPIRKKFLKILSDLMGPYDEGSLNSKGRSGEQSIGKPGVGPNPKKIDPSYVDGADAKIGPGGNAVTSCGVLPGRIGTELIGEAETPGEFGDVKHPTLVAGPQGNFLLAKFMRAYVPAISGASPRPGDLFFLEGKDPGTVVHIGVVYSVQQDPSSSDREIWFTAEAGQGPVKHQTAAWFRKPYIKGSVFRLIGPSGEGAEQSLPPDPKGKGRRVKGWMDVDKYYANISSKKYEVGWKEVMSLLGKSAYNPYVWQNDSVFPEDEDLTYSEIVKRQAHA